MAILIKCSECGKEIIKSVSDFHPLCDKCKRKYGWKSWEEMTLEEKVENLNERISNSSMRIG